MKKSNLGACIALAAAVPCGVAAEVTLYGKANLSFEKVDLKDQDESHTELMSNASRLGFKGSEKINDSLEAIYQLEYEVYVDDGEDVRSVGGQRDDRSFRQRNIFVGVKGGFGQVIGGHFDTPLKGAQGKVDVFNDLRGDIRSMITNNDHRLGNTVMYSSPKFAGFGAHLGYITSENEEVDEGKSAAVYFDNHGLYASVAFEQDVVDENSETLRAVLAYTIGGLQVGGLFEQDDQEGAPGLADPEEQDGWLASVLYDFQNNWLVKAQYGESDIRYLDADTTSVGVDYKLSKNFTVFSFYTADSAEGEPELDPAAESDDIDREYFGLGVELKF